MQKALICQGLQQKYPIWGLTKWGKWRVVIAKSTLTIEQFE